MTRWLCIEATFLSGRYHGKRREGAEAEWPPAPHRLFQALLAAAHLGTRDSEWSSAKERAFRWLERREPPEISAPRGQALSSFALSVPNNDMDQSDLVRPGGKATSQLRSMKPMRPTLVNGDATVRFLWPIAEKEWSDARPHAEILTCEARYLHSLGLGSDLVAGNGRVLEHAEKLCLPGEIWRADTKGRKTRVPREGSFDELVERHVAFLNRIAKGRAAARFVDPPAPPSVANWVSYRRRAEGDARAVHAFDLLKSSGSRALFDQRKTIHVAAWLRHAAHEAAMRLRFDPEWIAEFICGHGRDENGKSRRLSYLPLPTLGHAHADGRIRRALLVQPFGPGDERITAIARVLSNGVLTDEAGEIKADLRGVDAFVQSASDKLFSRYLGRSSHWGSVTPVVLPGLDDRKSRKSAALVTKALAQAGYATPVAEISVQREPVFPGAEMAGTYIVPDHLSRWPRVHVIIRFSEEFAGPLAIGGGRHSGLGVFASLEIEGNRMK